VPQDYYKTLDLSRAATSDDIKHAYRRLARKYHPDLNPGDPSALDRMEDLNRAYEVLADPQKRAEYDGYARQAERQPRARTGASFEQARQRAATLERLSPYEVLAVSPKATYREIRDAFAGFVHTYGEAAIGDPAAAMAYRHVKSAYSLLSNSERRRQYNAEHGLPDPPRPEEDATERPIGVLDGLGDLVWIIPAAIVVLLFLLFLLFAFKPYWI
jgi:DnaJ-class molecular chaperone